MPGDPANVGHASELVIGVNVKDVFDGQSSAKEVATSGVHDTLGLTGGSGSLSNRPYVSRSSTEKKGSTGTHVENEQRIFRRHDLRRAVVRDFGGLFVPPLITSLGPGHVVARAAEDEDMLDTGRLLDGSVRNNLGRDRLSATTALVRGDEDARLAVVHPITEGLRRETGEHDRVHSANSRAGEEGGDGLPCHGKVDGHGVALLHAERLEHVRDAADLAQELRVRDLAALVRLVCLVDDRRLCARARVRLDSGTAGADARRFPPYRGA